MGVDFFSIFHVLDTYKGMNEWGSVWGLGFRGYKGGEWVSVSQNWRRRSLLS